MIVVRIGETYFQCARALVTPVGDHATDLPTAGDFLAKEKDGFDGRA